MGKATGSANAEQQRPMAPQACRTGHAGRRIFPAGFAKEIARSSPIDRGVALGARSMSEGDNPYDRMRLVLERGWLLATRSATGEEDEGEEVDSPWQLEDFVSATDKYPRKLGFFRRARIERGAARVLEEEGQILFLREQVIAAETRIS